MTNNFVHTILPLRKEVMPEVNKAPEEIVLTSNVVKRNPFRIESTFSILLIDLLLYCAESDAQKQSTTWKTFKHIPSKNMAQRFYW
jgi:hypothetical protein